MDGAKCYRRWPACCCPNTVLGLGWKSASTICIHKKLMPSTERNSCRNLSVAGTSSALCSLKPPMALPQQGVVAFRQLCASLAVARLPQDS